MIVATSMLTPPKSVVRVRFLPRTLPLQTLAIVIATAVIGFMISTSLMGSGLEAVVYGLSLGGFGGYMLTRMSPLEGEGIFTWLGLHAKSASVKKVTIDGVKCARYIGFAPLHWVANGPVRLVPGAIEVRATGWDERGYPEWGADEEKETSTSLLQRHMANRPTNVLRPMAGMSLAEITLRQEEEREAGRNRLQSQLSKRKRPPKNNNLTPKPKKKKQQPMESQLRPTAGLPKRPEPVVEAVSEEKPAKTSKVKKRPKKVSNERKPKRDKAKGKAPKLPGKKSRQKNPEQALQPTAGRMRR